MKRIWDCRRTFVAVFAIVALMILGLVKGLDVGTAIAGVAVGLAGANAAEGSMVKKKTDEPPVEGDGT